MEPLTTDVLVIGSGPAGASAALFLATYGVEHLVITKYRWTANTPRSHITNQRTVEIFRDMGIEDDIIAQATPHHLMGDTVFCTSLAGDEIGRIRTWGTHPAREADYRLASPSLNCDLPQTLLEPILIGHAASRGSRIRFDTEYVGMVQDDDGVTVTALDRATGTEYQIRAKYVIGADGGRSRVAADLNLPTEGRMDVAGSMNIVFHADLSHLVGHRPSVLYWVLQPGADIGGIGLGLVRMVRPWNEWLVVWGYDINEPPPDVDDAMAIRIVHNLVGEDVPVTIRSTSLWGNNKLYATRYRDRRVFCMGDAVHRHPPSNGLGSNTSVQDTYNLAWKLAYVLRPGVAGSALLDTYDPERTPISRRIVLRATRASKSSGRSSRRWGSTTPAIQRCSTSGSRRVAATRQPPPSSSRLGLLELKNYEFNAHGVEIGQRYASAAVVPDGTPEPAYERDPELYYHPTTWPGARLPHCWLGLDGHKVSTLDLVGRGRFALLTGTSGEAWADAARTVSEALGIEIDGHVIGPGRTYTDLYEDWARLRAVGEDGCVLVRPDGHVAWRSASLTDQPAEELTVVLRRILAR